jgi:hypothetical protein
MVVSDDTVVAVVAVAVVEDSVVVATPGQMNCASDDGSVADPLEMDQITVLVETWYTQLYLKKASLRTDCVVVPDRPAALIATPKHSSWLETSLRPELWHVVSVGSSE